MSIETITPHELQSRLATDPDLLLLDVRTPLEFDQVHIPAARNAPLSALETAQWIPREDPKPIYLLCHSGTRAKLAAQKFLQDGFSQTIVVAGGTEAWVETGLPVNRGAGGAISLERQVRIAAGSLVFIGVALGWLVHPGFFGLAAFVGAGLVFAGITDFCGMGLLLARAPWNQRSL
ncbi:MAG: rhodanese-like domain-containing protein [Chthoniobacteraceae bacterium]